MKGGARIMAIYHLSMQIMSRSRGQSAVAAAAYRSGERLQDERTGEEKFYHREVQPDSMILAPSNSPEWVNDRERLWNEVEKVEIRKDSQLAREINIALPVELSNEKQKELIRDFVQEQFVDKGMIADISIHKDDKANPHAHVMLTMRTIDENGFGKKNRDWNADFANSRENSRGFVKSSKNCLDIREQWSNYANKALEREGVQERISHLSHADRGLEQLPTVHLGHVANEMEKRGIQTPQGDINRDRQEYNALVIDLQKYKEEKQAIEKEMARKQEQRQNLERFYTPQERTVLQAAKKYLKEDPTFKNIAERNKQLDKWSDRLKNSDQFIAWKSKTINEAAYHYEAIDRHQKTIQEQQNIKDNLNWINPFKFNENRAFKENAEQRISNCQEQIQKTEEQLNYHREKLGFQTEDEFKKVQAEYMAERPGIIEENRNKQQRIHHEREALKHASHALQNGFIRRVASQYPNHPEMRLMNFKTAQEIQSLNQKADRVVSVDEIRETYSIQNDKLKQCMQKITFAANNADRLDKAKEYLDKYNEHNKVVAKYENSIFMKGKLLVSDSAKKEYDKAISGRDLYEEKLKEVKVTGLDDWSAQSASANKLRAEVPALQVQVRSLRTGVNLLDSILTGVEQAGRSAERMQHRQQLEQAQRAKGKGRNRQNGWDMDQSR